jgi:hypothetical protein
MDKAIQLARGDRLYEIMQIWNEGVNLSKQGFLKLGEAIHFIKTEKLWKYDGTHCPSFKSWAENALHISVSQAHRLAQIYTEVGHILSNGIDGIAVDISKVTLLLPYLEGQPDDVKRDMLTEASLLSVEAIKNNLRSRNQIGTPTDECEHPPEMIVLMSRCNICGKWIK